MFVPCTTLLYDSTAAIRTLKFSTTLLSISCGICLISFLMMPSLVCGLFSQTVFQVPPQKIVREVEILGIGWLGFISFTRYESVPWEVMPEVFNCSALFEKWGGASFFKQNRTHEYLRHNFPWGRFISRQTDNPRPSYSQDLNPPDYFLRE